MRYILFVSRWLLVTWRLRPVCSAIGLAWDSVAGLAGWGICVCPFANPMQIYVKV